MGEYTSKQKKKPKALFNKDLSSILMCFGEFRKLPKKLWLGCPFGCSCPRILRINSSFCRNCLTRGIIFILYPFPPLPNQIKKPPFRWLFYLAARTGRQTNFKKATTPSNTYGCENLHPQEPEATHPFWRSITRKACPG